MANSAPYEVNWLGSDDETLTFTLPFENADGTDFPFDIYEIEYSIPGVVSLSKSGGGIAVNGADVTFTAPQTPCGGTYQHGCRIRHLVTGIVSQVFDGTITIAEGNF